MMAAFRSRVANFLAPPVAGVDPREVERVLRQVGWSESKLYVGTDYPKYNPDDLIGRKSHKIYQRMMIDEQVKAVVHFKRDAITSRDYFFEMEKYNEHLPKDEVARRIDIYYHMMDAFRGSFSDGLNFILKAIWQGFSLTEKIVEPFDYLGTPYLGISKLAPKPFDTFEFYTDEFGNVVEVRQQMDGQEQTIDLSKFVYFVQNPDKEYHYGQSELREAYRSWFSKDAAIRFYNIFLERMAGGLPVATVPKEMHSQSPEFVQLKQIMETIQSMTSLVVPEGVAIDMKMPKTSDQFEKAVVLHDIQIAKALLVPNLLGITHTGQTGSFSQSQTQLEAFLWTLDADKDRLEDSLNEQVFGPLNHANFADGMGPRFRFNPISNERLKEIVAAWKDLVAAKAVEASDTDEAHLRELLDFPEKGEPLAEPASTQPAPGRGGDRPVAPGDEDEDEDEDEDDGETIVGARAAVVSDAAFNRARRRVATSVIDRKTGELQDRYVDRVGSQVAELVAALALRVLDEDLGTPKSDTGPSDVRVSARDLSKLKTSVGKMLDDAWSLGTKHARTEITRARGSFKVNMARLGESAEEFLAARSSMIVGDITENMLRVVRSVLANAVKYSWTPRESVRRIYDRLTLSGYVLTETNAEVTGRTTREVLESLGESPAPLYHIKTVVRTNNFEAMNEARFSTFTDPELDDFVEALEYSAILDSRTTAICQHLDGRVYPAGAPEWDSYRPPNHFNCRSILIPVTVIDTDVEGRDKQRGSRWSKAPRVEPQTGFGGGTG